MATQQPARPGDTPPQRTVWLSGEILTLLNKIVFPIVWLALLIALPLWVFLEVGHLSIAPGFRLLVAAVLLATGFMLWLTVRLQRVGYRGRELVLSNYWREASVPFDDVEGVERVWWYRGRMVRIRFRRPTPFGSTIYYLPKWGPLRCFFAAPEEELRTLLAGDIF